ncbi:MAG: ROK family protein, partial [Bacteroidales bacterium]|nr:ROK family protein [Bacteroidales bacterium]
SSAAAHEIISAWAKNITLTANNAKSDIAGIGMAIPGPFDYAKGISLIENVGKFDRLFGLNVGLTLSASLGKNYDLRFVNDASAFALGECNGGVARESKRCVAITLGTGVGSGFVVDSCLVEDGEGVPANGWVYCLPFEGGIVDDAFSTRWFQKQWLAMSGEKIAGAADIVARIDTDPHAAEIFALYGQRLGEFLSEISADFHPDTIVLGGNIARSFSLFSSSMKDKMCSLGCIVDVTISQLWDNAAIIGAASLFSK